MLSDLTLFTTVAKKYESIASLSINRYISLCENKIEKIFLICDDSVDVSKFKFDIKFEYMTDSTAVKILKIDKPEYECITYDKWLLQQWFKLNCDILSGSDDCVITDVDGLLLKPINYLTNNKLNLFHTNLTIRKKQTYRTTKFFFGTKLDYYNFISENIIFRKKYLVEARKKLGDFRQYRSVKNSIYDLTIEEYHSLAGRAWPTPAMTNYKMFNDKSYNNVIFASLPKDIQTEILSKYKPRNFILRSNCLFSEYEFYSYFLLVNYPQEINLTPMTMQLGFIFEKDPDYYINESTPGGREDTFLFMYNNYAKMKTSLIL